jgi:nitric oxide reductase activation protein
MPCFSQGRATAPPAPPSSPDYSVAPASEDEATERMAHDMAKKANQERAAELKADTDKLLKLAEQLKASVDKSNENVLSLDVIKKAEEIEKLAHSVKDKMKGPI